MNESTVLTSFPEISTGDVFYIACALALGLLFFFRFERQQRIRLTASIACSLAVLLIGANDAYAGFLDDIANKATRAAKDAVGSIVRDVKSTASNGNRSSTSGVENAQERNEPQVLAQAQSNASTPSTTESPDYPWDHVDADMRTEEVDATLTESGLVGDRRTVDHAARHFNQTYRGKWRGKWPAIVQVKARKGVITYMRFELTYLRSDASRIADYFSKILPEHYAGTGSCGRDGDRVSCSPLKDEALSDRRGYGCYHHIDSGPDRKTGKSTKVYYELSWDTHGFGQY